MGQVGLKCLHLGGTATPVDAKISGLSKKIVTYEDHSPMMLPDIIH